MHLINDFWNSGYKLIFPCVHYLIANNWCQIWIPTSYRLIVLWLDCYWWGKINDYCNIVKNGSNICGLWGKEVWSLDIINLPLIDFLLPLNCCHSSKVSFFHYRKSPSNTTRVCVLNQMLTTVNSFTMPNHDNYFQKVMTKTKIQRGIPRHTHNYLIYMQFFK
jgi:hypothetical protein